MTREQTDERKVGTPGNFSRGVQQKMNARTIRRIRSGVGRSMGMDLLILHTMGKRSSQPRETPLAWFPDGEDAWLIVASGGESRHPDWYINLMAGPNRVSIEFPGRDNLPVAPQRLDGADREQAWHRIVAAQPRLAKYQDKTDREYPVIRLSPR